jgi:hypothetical protein
MGTCVQIASIKFIAIFHVLYLRSNNPLLVACFLLGNYPASGFYMPTFRNTLSVPSSQAGRCEILLTSMKMEQTKCSETSAYKLQTPGNYPKESIQHTEHGESLKSRTRY